MPPLNHKSLITLLGFITAFPLSGCSIADRLSRVNETPKLSAISDPTAATGYRRVSLPMPFPKTIEKSPNSLWESGSNAFFKDNRARDVGDILTVSINISDNANLSSTTSRSRSGSDTESISNLAGFETALRNALPGDNVNLAALINANGASSSNGTGSIERSDSLQTNITALITQILPNRNMVIEGRQEVRINDEVRELIIAGVIRPQDIDSANTIDASKIAEARISYGGRGVISDVQKPRYGQEVLDILLPF